MSLLNLHGHSPLVDYCFHKHNLKMKNDIKIFIKHMTIKNIPSTCFETYNDLIKASYQKLKYFEKEYKK
jgi:hypothetical protein